MMIKNCLTFACLVLFSISQTIAEESKVGRHISTSYAMDTVDHYAGTLSFTATDYQILMGPGSYFPLMRTTLIDGKIGKIKSIIDLYNLGQLVDSGHDEGDICPKGGDSQNTFTVPNGEQVVFHSVNLMKADSYRFLSKSNWLLSCLPDRNGYTKQLISPDGVSYYYKFNESMAYTESRLSVDSYPKLIVDANGNEMTVKRERLRITLKTRYQTITINRTDIQVSDYSEPVVKLETLGNGYKVTYFNEAGWLYKSAGDHKVKVCNPMNMCGVYEFEYVYEFARVKSKSRKLTRKTYTIPHYGSYKVSYEYSLDNSSKTILAKYPDQIREYKFFDDHALWSYLAHRTSLTSKQHVNGWKQGLPISEIVWNAEKTAKLQEITYQHQPSMTYQSFLHSDSPGFSSHRREVSYSNKVSPRLTEKTIKRWAKNAQGRYIWVGTVKENYSDFNKYNQPQKVTYSYPDESGGNLFPSISYITKYDVSKPVHRIDLVKESYVEGSNEKISYIYDNFGNVKSQTVNGLTTSFEYNSHGGLIKTTDPENNVRTFHDFQYGIPTYETGPEGFTATRTVEKGFVKTETTWGDRTVTYDYDPFGKLREFKPAEDSRLPVRYRYEYPASGGLELIEENGKLTKHTYLNGFGKPYKVVTQGLSSGTGSAYAYKKEFEYFYDGSVKSESAVVDINTTITNAHRTIYTQDATGRRIQLDPADDKPITFEYPEPFMTKMTDSVGVVTYEYYRPFAAFGSEQLIKRRHPKGNTVPSPELSINIDYLKNGKLNTVKVGNAMQYFNYNTKGLLKSYSTPETGLIQFDYDNNGNVIWEKHNSDSPITYKYDHLNRLTKKEYADTSLNVDYSYDDFNRIHTVEKSSFGWKYTFDKDEAILQAQLSHKHNLKIPSVVNEYPVYSIATGLKAVNNGKARSGSTTFEYYQYEKEDSVSHSGGTVSSRGYLDWLFKYDYDTQGFLSRITYPDGEEVGYMRNGLGQPTQAGSYVSGVEYWPNGGIRKIKYGNGLVSEFKQDAVLGKLKEIQHGNFWHKRYGYRSTSYVNSIIDVLNKSKSIYMDYDQLYQLKNVHKGSASGSVIEAFAYTASGDMRLHTMFGKTTNYSYSASTNRLASVKQGNATRMVGYTPDGRVTTFGEDFYGYGEDKLLTHYDANDGNTYTYLYDGNDKKIKTLKNGKLERYTIYDSNGKLIYEEKPGDVTSNMIYLDDRLVAKRDGQYDIVYTECDYIEKKNKFETELWHRPVYLHKQSQEPVAYGDCELYSRWVHDFESNSGLWETLSKSKREYWVWVNQYAVNDTNKLENKGALYKWLYKDMYVVKDRMERRYKSSGTKRKYQCYRHYNIVKRTFNLKTGQYVTNTVKTGNYYTGRQKIWRMWKKKPKKFSCLNPGVDLNKVSWPSMSGQ